MTRAEILYKDIIDKERPKSPEILQKHPRMRLEDRAKIFAPFSALRGLDEALENEAKKGTDAAESGLDCS